MKKSIILIFVLFVALHAKAQQADFYKKYNAMDSMPERSKLVYNLPEAGVWDSDTFYFQIRTPKGISYFSIAAPTGQLTEQQAPFSAPKTKPAPKEKRILSPDGKYEALIEDSNIWIKEIGSQTKRQLSNDGTLRNAYTRVYWSPDSKKIAAIKTQDTPIRKIPLIESAPAAQKQPIISWVDYFKPGDLIPIHRPALFDIESNRQIPIDTHPFEHQYTLRFVRWNANSEAFTFEFNQRGHQLYQIVDVNAHTGATNVIINEQSNTFIYYNRLFLKYIENGSQIVWASERSGWNHLYLIDAAQGNVIRPITSGEWVVRSVIDINEKEGYLLISGNGKNKKEDPYNIHYYKVYYKGAKAGDIESLTPEIGNHTAIFSPDNNYFLDTYSTPQIAPTAMLKKVADGSVIHNFGQADISALLAAGWRKPELFSAKGRDGKTDIFGNIYFPSDFDPAKKYPVVEYIYAGPHDAFVEKNFRPYERYHKLTDLGFIVVTIDGMGTANRSKAFHDVCWRDLKDSGFPDRIEWIKSAAKKYKQMDISQGVGIYGYSAGGQSTLAALLFFGDFYKTGVSLCGCHDNRMDKIWWNEQWMGYPIGEWYSRSSNVDNAKLLQGDLLLINGELDSNVDPTSTLQVVDALIKADKHFEQLYLPGYGHSLGDKYVTGRVYEFLWRKMKK